MEEPPPLSISLPDFIGLVPILLPIFNLALVFSQQSTSGFLPGLASIAHVFSNPVDALWSILCRQEYMRRCQIFATINAPDVARELTAVLSTYDQWLDDARPHLSRSFASRRRFSSADAANHDLLVTGQEKLLIRKAALRLRSCRSDSRWDARLSIMSYAGSLAAVAYRIFYSTDMHVQREAGHLLASIAMFSHLVLAVYLNGCVGAFVHQEEAARIIFELCDSLGALQSGSARSSPLLPLPTPGTSSPESLMVYTNAAAFFRFYQSLGTASGTLNSLRPRKSNISDDEGRHHFTLLAIAMCAVVISLQGAVAIHLFAAMDNAVVELLLPVGSFALWILNWQVSFISSCLFTRKRLKVETYSYIVLSSNLIVTALIVACFGWSFFSRTPDTSHVAAPVDIATIMAWFALMFLIFLAMLFVGLWANVDGENARLVYVRSREEALADSDAIFLSSQTAD